MHTHLEQWAADAAAPGEQLGVRCPAQGSHLSRRQFLPELRFEPTTSGYKSDALSIRATTAPRLEICVHCELFSMKKLRSRLSLFLRKEGAAVCFPRFGTHRCRGTEENEGELLDCDDAISLTSSDPVASALLGYAQEEQEMFEGEEVETEPSQSSCPVYEERLEVMERATARLDLPWERTKMAASRGSMSGIFLAITPQHK